VKHKRQSKLSAVIHFRIILTSTVSFFHTTSRFSKAFQIQIAGLARSDLVGLNPMSKRQIGSNGRAGGWGFL
jgi:hypothetical protein